MSNLSMKTGPAKGDSPETIHFLEKGDASSPCIIWAHGWGQSHKSFEAMAGSLEKSGRHLLIDFPGFGDSPVPREIWGTEEYADALAAFIKSKTKDPVIWVGHSFGCRVGLQLASRHPDLISGLFLISAAGLSRKRPLLKKLYLKIRVLVFKTLKKLTPFGVSESWLMKTFASPDYLNAGPLRQIFVKVVNEDLSEIARQIQCPVKLIYGAQDTETPPEIGKRLHMLIEGSEMVQLEGQDHYTIIADGRHQTVRLLKEFIESLK